MAEGEDPLDCLVRGAGFGFADGTACLFLTDGFLGNGTTTSHDEKFAHGSVLEEFNISTVVDSISNPAAPFCVTEALEQLFRWGGSSISVRFTVMGGGVVKVGWCVVRRRGVVGDAL